MMPATTWTLTMVSDKVEDGTAVNNTLRQIFAAIGSSIVVVIVAILAGGTIDHNTASVVAFNQNAAEEALKAVACQVVAMNPVAVNADEIPQEKKDEELNIAIIKTKEEQIQKAVEAALKKAGLNPNHFDSEDHIESNTAKGWITPEEAAKGRQIMKEAAEQKAANLPEAMIQNIAMGRLNKFFKEKTLNEQILALGDGKETVAQYLKRMDPEVKVLSFRRFSLSD